MKVRIIRHVPGLVCFRPLTAGTEHDLEIPTAVSLMEDGYAAPMVPSAVDRAVPAEQRETATANPGRRPGRPRREG